MNWRGGIKSCLASLARLGVCGRTCTEPGGSTAQPETPETRDREAVRAKGREGGGVIRGGLRRNRGGSEGAGEEERLVGRGRERRSISDTKASVERSLVRYDFDNFQLSFRIMLTLQ